VPIAATQTKAEAKTAAARTLADTRASAETRTTVAWRSPLLKVSSNTWIKSCSATKGTRRGQAKFKKIPLKNGSFR
jgi:hypothetical protein